MADEVVVLVSCPPNEAEGIASHLVQAHVAACVNIVPAITSVYRWKGELCKESESLLVIKSARHLWEHLERAIREVHSYEVPEIICLPIQIGHKPYLNWLNSELADVPQTTGKEG